MGAMLTFLMANTCVAWTSQQLEKSPGSTVAGLPIPIPRPVQLERMQQIPAMSATGSSQSSMMPLHDFIQACDLVEQQGNEVTLRVHYQVSPGRKLPIYAGAWLYDAQDQPVDAGYKPVAIRAFPEGDVDVTLVLPKENFNAQYVVTFLMESGQPAFVNGHFSMPYRWEDGMLTLSNQIQTFEPAAPAFPAIQDKQAFCQAYAQKAVAQFDMAMANNLPGIVPPVWSRDAAGHYNWCMGVSIDTANQGSALRQNQLDRYSMPAGKDSGVDLQPGTSMPKPAANKKLDPGLGP